MASNDLDAVHTRLFQWMRADPWAYDELDLVAAVPALVAAVRAVLDLHEPSRPYRADPGELCCKECRNGSDWDVPWPCATVSVVIDNLLKEAPR